MAAPTLRLRRGSGAPSGSIAVLGEPFFDTGGDLYVATGTSTFSHIGGTTYTARVDESLTAATSTTSGEVTILSRTDQGGSVIFDVASTANTSTYTWPDAPSGAKVLQSDANGDLSWVDQTSGYSGWTVSDGTNSENIGSTDSVTFTGGTGIDTSYNTTSNVLTVAIDGTVATSSSTLAFFAATTSAQLAGVINDETGSGALVFANSPTLVTPALGTPTSGTLTNCTGLPISSGVSGLGTNVATFLGTPSSANLASAVTDETGSGALVFGTSPVLTTPQINDTSADHQYVFAVSELTADRTVTLPLLGANDTFVFETHAQTLTNKTIDGGSNTLSNIANASLTNSSITIGSDAISLGGTRTDLNGITSLDVDNITIDGNTITTSAGNLTVNSTGGTTTVDDNLIVSGNLTVNGTTTTISTTNSVFEDTLLLLNRADGTQPVNNTNDIGLYLERGSAAAEDEVAVVFDESEDEFVIAFTSSAGTVSTVVFQDDAAATPTLLDFVPLRVGALRIQDASSQLAGGLISAGGTASVSVIETLSAAESETEGVFDTGTGEAGRYLLNVTVDGGFY